MSVRVPALETAGSKAGTPERLVDEAVGHGFCVTRFVENFDVLVNVAGSAKHLKELVLNLAVSGGLLSADDETADALVAGLRRERISLAKAGIRIGENSPPVTDEEAPYAVPLGWRWIRLRDLGGFLGGGTPAKSNPAFWKGTLPWVSPKDMKRPYIDDAEDHISTAAVEGSSVKLIPAQSVLYVVRGMILAHSFPVAVTTREVTINQDMKALVLAIPELSEFILLSCQAARTRVLAKVERSSHGTCRLESEAVEMLPIALPPLAEQKRIVARVAQLMVLIDELETKQTKKREISARLTKASLEAVTTAGGPEEFDPAWKRLVENFPTVIDRAEKVEALRAAVLDLAVQGRFARTVLPESDADLARLGEERLRLAKAGGIKSRETKPLTNAEVGLALPPAWRWLRLGDICHQITDGTHHTPQYIESGVPFLSVKDVTGPALNFSNVRYISPEEHAVLSKRCKPERDDILFTKVGTTGVARVVETDREFSIFVSLALLKFPTTLVHPKFLCLVLNSPFVRRQSAQNTQGIGNKNLVLKYIRECIVPLPPLAAQAETLGTVDHLMKLCDDLEAKLRRTEDRTSKLVEAVVQEIVA